MLTISIFLFHSSLALSNSGYATVFGEGREPSVIKGLIGVKLQAASVAEMEGGKGVLGGVSEQGNVVLVNDLNNTNIVTTIITTPSTAFQSISLSPTHTIATDTTHRLWAWGSNTFAESSGNGKKPSIFSTVPQSNGPTPLTESYPWKDVPIVQACSGKHLTAVLTATRRVFVFGLLESSTSSTAFLELLTPHAVQINGTSEFSVTCDEREDSERRFCSIPCQIVCSASKSQFHVVRSDGTVWVWDDQPIIPASDENNNIPEISMRQVEIGDRVCEMASGKDFEVSVMFDQSVLVWSDRRNRTISTTVLKGENVLMVAAGTSHALALTANGTVFSWGENSRFQLGRTIQENTTVWDDVPEQIELVKHFGAKSIFAGGDFSVVLATVSTPSLCNCANYFGRPNVMLTQPKSTEVDREAEIDQIRQLLELKKRMHQQRLEQAQKNLRPIQRPLPPMDMRSSKVCPPHCPDQPELTAAPCPHHPGHKCGVLLRKAWRQNPLEGEVVHPNVTLSDITGMHVLEPSALTAMESAHLPDTTAVVPISMSENGFEMITVDRNEEIEGSVGQQRLISGNGRVMPEPSGTEETRKPTVVVNDDDAVLEAKESAVSIDEDVAASVLETSKPAQDLYATTKLPEETPDAN
eukprot:c5678_g1_i2.p1 GENE.c5678_g1_i2~~c5678_g1_i2.p1  ORF type:complete len:639 (+),score=223.35 c5678_g1_i2:79-1995(+)